HEITHATQTALNLYPATKQERSSCLTSRAKNSSSNFLYLELVAKHTKLT
ncbi:15488_t:CDS:1, partial [Gigaspora margarita]